MAVNQAKQTIDNRINAYGVAEPNIAVTEGYRVLVQLPGVDDPERVRKLIKSTAFLEFRLVEKGPTSDRQTLLAGYGGRLPETLEIMEGRARSERADIGDSSTRCRSGARSPAAI